MSNKDVTVCYDEDCFRPAGLAWDNEGRLFMSSDQTGEIYAILRADGSNTSSAGSGETGSIPSGGGGSGGSGGGNGGSGGGGSSSAASLSMSVLAVVFGVLAFVF